MNVNTTSGDLLFGGKNLGQSQNASEDSFNKSVSNSILSWALSCIGLFLLLFGNTDLAIAQTQTFSANGTFTVPAGVHTITVECWGGGGRGANRTSNGTGWGGGGGAYSKKIITSATGAYTVTVGTGSSSTTPGGDSWFGTAGTVMAKGGSSGAANQTSAIAGGTAAASIGDVKFNGGSSGGGGGGSSAGNAANGNNSTGGTGATAPAGGGSGGNVGASFQSATNGAVPGGGGGGGFRNFIGTQAPGNGGNGRVVVTWTPPTIASFTPADICNGGTDAERTIVITGNNFNTTSSVQVNGTNAQSFTVNSNTQITAVISSATTSGQITVTANGIVTSTGSLTIKSSPVVGPITNGDATLCAGDTVDLDNSTPAGVWSSSNDNVATVDGNGIVTAVGMGTATISYSVTDLGCTTSQSTTITVNSPIVSSGPASTTVVTGTTATFTVSASGAVTSYQWKVSTDGGDTFTDLVDDATYSGSTTNTLTISNTSVAFNEYLYMVSMTALSPCPAVDSPAATLNVGDTGIATDPLAVTLCSDGAGVAVFNVTATGSVDSYQWEEDQGLGFSPITDGTFSGVTYSGSTTTQLTVSGLGLINSGWTYRAVAIGPTNNATSNGALLTVNEAISFATAPVAQSVCYSGGSASFTVSPTGPPSAFQWQYSTDGVNFNNVADNTPVGASYSGETTATLTVNTTAATPAAGTYLYRAVVAGTAPCGSASSASAQLSIYIPSISSQPVASTVAVGNSTTFTVATSEPSPSFQWQVATAVGGPYANVANGTPAGVTYSGATSPTLTVNVANNAAGATRFYRAIVTSTGCSVNSNGAQLTIAAYCTTSLTSTGDATDVVTNVSLTNVSTGTNFAQPSGGASPWYTFNNNTPFNIIQGQNLSVAITFAGDANQHSAIWVDYNRNGVFETSENVALSTSASGANSTVTYSFFIPFTTGVGTTRIRIRGASDSAYTAAGACSSTTYGETEDYVLNIIQATPCSGDPNPGTVTSNVTTICNSGTATLTVTGYASGFTGLSFQWYNSAGLIPGATGTSYTTPTLTANNSYYVRLNCSAGGFSDSNVVNITVNKPLVASTAPASRCGTGNITIGATPSAGATIKWYAAATGGSSLFTGNNYTINNLATTTTYYAEANIGSCLSTGRTAVTATIVPGPALTLSSASSTICAGFSTPLVTITAGQSDYDSFVWSPATGVSGTSETGYTFNPASTTVYTLSVVNSVTGCNRTTTHTVNVNALPSALNISPAAVTRCNIDNPTLLTASGGTVPNITIFTEDFNNNAPGWTITNNGSSASTWIYRTAPYSITSGDADFNNFSTPNGGKFAMANSDIETIFASTNTVLTSPVFSTVGFSTASLTFEQGYRSSGNDTSVRLQVSTDGGATWSLLVNYQGTSVGNTTNNAQTTANATVNLNAYVNQPNLRIRYNYVSNDGFYWIIDNIRIAGTDAGKVTWTPQAGLYTNAAGTIPYTGGFSNTVYADPATTTNYTATVTSISNCTTTNSVNVTVNQADNYYADTDGDGYGNPSVGYFGCAQAGFVLNNTDCNDSNGSVFQTGTFFIDVDGDGYNVGSSTICYGAAIPPGYSATTLGGNDCDDNDANAFQTGLLYTDADNDGYNNGTSGIICYGETVPSGYTMTDIGLDCNDNIAAVNPGQTEVLYNGLDDNCDGQLDEGFQVTSQILPSQCGTTLVAINSLISAVSTQQATGYRFEVTNTQTNAIQFIEKNTQYFSLNQLPAYDYATTYSIRVELQRNGVWLGYYGPSCFVSSPAVLEPGGAAQINASQCGITLSSINTLIATTSLPGVTSYRFKIINISDPLAPNHTQFIDRAMHWFSLPMLANYNYGTTYVIEVAVKTNGTYSAFGSPCQISAPPVPALVECGGSVALPTTHVSTSSLAKVTSYRFEVTNLNTNLVTTIDRPIHWFSFSMIPGYTPATPYGVRIAVMSGGVFSLFGDACEILSPGFARPQGPKEEIAEKTPFTAVAYPNPFAESFGIDVKTSADGSVNVKVYDMTGRLLESNNVELNEMQALQIGTSYPSGVYNLIIQQNDNVKTLRVIKR